MRFYFAPMEGLTGYIYRNAHKAFFNNIDKYFSPFIIANQKDGFKTRDLKDISPENNQSLDLIPQLMTNNAKDFIYTAKKIENMGYTEINLNLGCPSGTVVSKNRGCGFLAKKEELDIFLEEIFSQAVTQISIKTRIGKDQPEEFYDLINIFNKYPITELIIHPRIQKDFYKNKPNMEVFRDAIALSKNPVCYNGDIFTEYDYTEFCKDFPSVNTVMLGRGLLINPAFADNVNNSRKLEKSLLKEFHDKVYNDYKDILSGERNVLFKMKELWFYMINMFIDNEKYAKKIKKSQSLFDYEEAVFRLFKEQEIKNEVTNNEKA